VSEHFENLVGSVERRAKDGAMIAAIQGQVLSKDISRDISHIVVSIGGNNCLGHAKVLEDSCDNVIQGLLKLKIIVDEFEKEYERMICELLELKKPIILCAVYNPAFRQFMVTMDQNGVEFALAIFHSVLFNLARKYSLPVVDLRQVIDEDGDYAIPIELNEQGGGNLLELLFRRFVDILSCRNQSQLCILNKKMNHAICVLD
jgi:hypothetical protein